MKRQRRAKHHPKRYAFWAAVAVSAWLWFGFSSSDESSVRRFDQLADEWQTAPEFRRVADEYSVDGSRALATRPMFLSPGSVVMAMRSLPFLPKELAVNEGSKLHYQRFEKGPLSAYLHLCTELDVPTFANVLDDLTAKEPDALVRSKKFLEAFHMDEPVCMDVGAVESVASAIRDIDPAKPLGIRVSPGPLLLPHIRAIADDLGVPPEIDAMTFDQQLVVYQRLDAHVRQHDPELWRTKQLNDVCAGIWAQVYGPSYGLAITPVLLAHQFGGVAFVGLLMWGTYARRRRGNV